MPEIVSIVLLIVFILLFFLALLAAIAGFIKGLYKTMVKTILVACLLGVFIVLTPSITQAIGNIDLSSFGLSFQFNEQTILVTSIQETLANVITATGLISPMNGISIYQTAIALANSLLSYVIFFVLVLLTQLLIWLLTAIVYNGIFRWFLPVETAKQRRERKEMPKEMRYLTDGIYYEEEAEGKAEDGTPEVVDPYLQEEILRGQEPGEEYAEPFSDSEEEQDDDSIFENDGDFQGEDTRRRLPLLRFPGALIGACCEFVLAMVLVSPFTALARTALDHRETVNTILGGIDMGADISSEDIAASMDNVEESLVYKLLGFANFDTTIMNSVSRVEIGGKEVYFNSLVSSVIDIASPLIDDGAITFENGVTNITINFSILLNQTTVTTLTNLIIANPVVMALIPPAIDIGINTLSSSQSLPLGQLDFSNIDWGNQLQALSTIYSEIYGTGVIDSLFSSDGKKLTLDNFLIETSKDSISDADFAANLGKYTSALTSLGNLDVMKKNLPQIFASVGTYLNSTGIDILPTDSEAYAKIDWGKDLSLIGSSALRLCRLLDLDIAKDVDFRSALANISQDSFANTQEAKAFVAELEDILCGHAEADGTNVPGLLDCGIIDVIDIGDVMESVMALIPALSAYVDGVDFSVLNGIENIKDEFRALFDIVEMILDPEFPIDIKDGFSGVDFSSQEVANALANVLAIAQDSELFTEMYPSIIQGFLTNEELQISDYLFGLTPYDFNFEASESFTKDFERLVRLMPRVYDLYKIMDEEGSTEEKFRRLDADAIGELLGLVAQSDFFNPDLKTGVSDKETGRNFNVYVLLSNLFDQPMFQDIGLVAPSLETIGKVEWTTSEGTGEIDRIVSLLKDAQKNASFLLNGVQGPIEDPAALSSMMENGLESEILQPSILAIINDSMNSFLSEMGINKTINQMRTELWKEDIDDLVDILTLAGELDFSDPDFFDNIDVKRLNALLTTLYNTNFIANCFGSPLPDSQEAEIGARRNRNFSELFSALIESQDLFGQLGIGSYNYGSLFVDSWSKAQEEIALEGDTSGRDYHVTTSGDIAGLCDFFSSVQEVGIDNLSGGKLPDSFLTEMVSSESKKSRVVMSLLSTVLSNTISELQIDESYKSAMASIDFYQLVAMSEAEIDSEFAFIETIYELSQPMEGGGQSRLEAMFSDIFNMDQADQADFTNLMTLMGDSKLMTTIREGKTRAPIGELLYNIFESTEGSSGTSFLSQITLAEASKDYAPYFDGLLSQVTDWKEELLRLDSFVKSFSTLGISDPDAFDALFTNPENADHVQEMLKTMNASALFHRVPISVFRDNVENTDGTGMASLFRNPATGEDRSIDFLVHLTNSEEDVLFWDNEIEHAVNLLFSVSDYLESGFEGVGIGAQGISLDLLYEIGSMELFRPVRANMVYNLVVNTAVGADTSSLVAEVFKDVFVYDEDENAYRIEKIFFDNPELLDANGKMDEARTKADIDALEKVLNTVLENLDTITNGNAESLFAENGLIVSFQELTSSAFYPYDGETHRSLLASELVAGLMKQILRNENIIAMVKAVDADFIGFGFTEEDFYGTRDDYPMVNPIEGRAIDAFLNALHSLMPTQEQTGLFLTLEDVKALLSDLAVPQQVTGDDVLDAFADSYRQGGLVNARFATNETVYSIIRILPVFDGQGFATIGQFLGDSFDPVNDSFQDVADSIVLS